MTLEVGSRVRMLSGFLGAGRTGSIIDVQGDAFTVEFSGPRYLLAPQGEQEIKRLPYAVDELEELTGPDRENGSER